MCLRCLLGLRVPERGEEVQDLLETTPEVYDESSPNGGVEHPRCGDLTVEEVVHDGHRSQGTKGKGPSHGLIHDVPVDPGCMATLRGHVLVLGEVRYPREGGGEDHRDTAPHPLPELGDISGDRSVVDDEVVTHVHLVAVEDKDAADGIVVPCAVVLDPVLVDQDVLAESQGDPAHTASDQFTGGGRDVGVLQTF